MSRENFDGAAQTQNAYVSPSPSTPFVRIQALDYAIKSRREHESPDAVVTAAETYFKFLNNAKEQN